MSRRIRVLLILTLLASACGEAPAAKSLYSRWVSGDGSSLDLSAVSSGNQFVAVQDTDGSLCSCVFSITGNATKGTIHINQCVDGFTPNPFGQISASDCENWDLSFDFEIDGATMQLCAGGSCSAYN